MWTLLQCKAGAVRRTVDDHGGKKASGVCKATEDLGGVLALTHAVLTVGLGSLRMDVGPTAPSVLRG